MAGVARPGRAGVAVWAVRCRGWGAPEPERGATPQIEVKQKHPSIRDGAVIWSVGRSIGSFVCVLLLLAPPRFFLMVFLFVFSLCVYCMLPLSLPISLPPSLARLKSLFPSARFLSLLYLTITATPEPYP
ncbi:hypothetical protein B0H14DRAFT_1708771 [Mycena olivaceomarginata]|nr:hypothetical protein B0H14DRAFT_1708771 [Mycena olivaceomarginata]